MIKKTYAINLLIPFKISDCDGTEFVDYDGQLKNTYGVVHDIDIGTMLKCILLSTECEAMSQDIKQKNV